jgi:hypothetical protein
LGLVVLSAGFVVMGGFLVTEGQTFGWLCMAFFGLGVLVGLVSLVPGASYLELRRDGFEFRTLHRKWFQRWSDVEAFFPQRIATQDMVCWNFAPGYAGQPRGRKVSAGLTGVEAGLPDTYGMSAHALAELMNQWRIRYAGRSDPGAGSAGQA